MKNTLEDLCIHSTKKFRGKLFVSEYLDMSTGEIIPAKNVHSKSIRPEGRIRREEKIKALRSEVRNFALFLLKFRSQGGGFLIDLPDLVRWYAKLTGKQVKHINRYIPKLVDGGVLDFDKMLNEDFMWFDSSATKAELKGNTFKAYRIFSDMLLKKQAHSERSEAHPDMLEAA